MRKAAVIELNQEERQTLQKLAKARSSKRHEALRARTLLLAAEDRTNLQISAEVGLHYNAIGKTPRSLRGQRPSVLLCIDDRRQVPLGNGVFTKPLPPSDSEKSTTRDITARKHAEEQLANDAEELREKNAPLEEDLAAARQLPPTGRLRRRNAFSKTTIRPGSGSRFSNSH